MSACTLLLRNSKSCAKGWLHVQETDANCGRHQRQREKLALARTLVPISDKATIEKIYLSAVKAVEAR
jgi:hypothetical protein